MYNNFNKLQLNKQKYELLISKIITNNPNYQKDYLKINSILNQNVFIMDQDPSIDSNLSFNEDYLKKILDFTNLDINLENTLNLNPYNIDEILEIVYDFFNNNFNNYYANIFNKIFNNKKNNLMFSNKRSYSIYLETLNYSYINIENKLNFDTVMNLIHEYGHAVGDYICYKDINSNYELIELPSSFFELIALNNFNNEDSKIYKKYMLDALLSYANHIKEAYLKNIETNQNKINSYEKYVISYLTSIELLYLYLEDKELCLDILFKLLVTNNPKQILENNNIILNTNTKKYIKTN